MADLSSAVVLPPDNSSTPSPAKKKTAPKAANTPSLGSLEGELNKTTQQAEQDTTALQNSVADITKSFHESLQTLKDQAPKVPEEKPFQAPQEEDPLKAFGSKAMVLAGIASLFTRTPLTTSLNALAGGMKAINDGNATNYQRSYDEWKTSTDYAFKAFDAENKHYDQLLNLAKTDYNGAMEGIKQIALMTDDKPMQLANEMKGLEGVEQLQIERQRLHNESQEQYYKIGIPAKIFKGYIDDWQKANPGQKMPADVMSKLYAQSQMSAGYSNMTTDQQSAMASMAASGMPLNQIVPGYGKDAQALRRQLVGDAIDSIRKQNPGMTAAQAGQEYANRAIGYASGKKSVGQLTTMLGATKQSIDQLDFNIDKTKDDMRKLPSSNISPVINALARGEERWTGNPAYSSLFYHMHAVATESARILSGGQASTAQLHQGAADEAAQWANVGMTPSSFDSVAQAMKDEGRYRLKTYQDAIGFQENGGASSYAAPSDQTSGASAPAATIMYDASGNRIGAQ